MDAKDIPQEPHEQGRGYLVVRRAPDWWTTFCDESSRRGVTDEYWAYVRRLRGALPGARPNNYRGFDRTPIERDLGGYARAQLGLLPAHALANMAASKLMWDRLGPDPTDYWGTRHFDPDLLPDATFAQEILMRTDAPNTWEVIEVSRSHGARPGERMLGFDVGYWGGDHFSIISDTMIAPRFHPAPPDAIEQLVPFAKQLNASMLFQTLDQASAFRAWYREQPWAEQEGHPDEFQIIMVSTAVKV